MFWNKEKNQQSINEIEEIFRDNNWKHQDSWNDMRTDSYLFAKDNTICILDFKQWKAQFVMKENSELEVFHGKEGEELKWVKYILNKFEVYNSPFHTEQKKRRPLNQDNFEEDYYEEAQDFVLKTLSSSDLGISRKAAEDYWDQNYELGNVNKTYYEYIKTQEGIQWLFQSYFDWIKDVSK